MPTVERLPVPVPAAPISPASTPSPPASVPPAGPTPFASLLEKLGARIDRGERAIERATKADLGPLDAPALIAIQAGIYRYVEAVDLAAKLVDRASNAVRSVLQGNH